MKRMRLYADGGSRGNPGPSASGYVLFELSEDDETGVKIFEHGEFLGEATNNHAEYMAIILGVTKARELGAEYLDVRLDSELAVKQLNERVSCKECESRKIIRSVT